MDAIIITLILEAHFCINNGTEVYKCLGIAVLSWVNLTMYGVNKAQNLQIYTSLVLSAIYMALKHGLYDKQMTRFSLFMYN